MAKTGKPRINFKQQEPDLMIYGCGEVLHKSRRSRPMNEVIDLLKKGESEAKTTPSDLSNYENNHRPVPYSMLKKLAAVYDLDEMELLFRCLAKLEAGRLFQDSKIPKNFDQHQANGTWAKFIRGGIQQIGMEHETSL